MLEVSRDAVAAGEEQLAKFAAEQSKYCFICTVALDVDPCGDFPFTSWGRWQCLRRFEQLLCRLRLRYII